MRDQLFDALVAETASLAGEFTNAGKSLYLVGGIVRDTLLGRVRAELDIDFTTNAEPDEIESIVRRSSPTALWTQGKRFGTIGATFVGPNGPRAVEITTHRAEQYHDDSRKPEVRFSTDITLDLSRRDFTVNAMAFDLRDLRLLDPFGGEEDLSARVLRTPLSPEISFRDDPLRMLRAARFIAALALTADPPLTDAVISHRERMAIISAERIRGELGKLLTLEDPSDGLRFLSSTGLVSTFLPELSIGDLQRRTARVLAMEPTWERRFTALLFGAFASEAVARSRLRALKCSVDEETLVVKIHRLGSVELADAVEHDSAARRLVYRAGSELDLFLSLQRADAVARMGAGDHDAEAVRLVVDALRLKLKSLARMGELEELGPALNGEEVMDLLGLSPGREVGEALAMLLELRLDEGQLPRPEVERRLMEWFDRHLSRSEERL